MKMKFDDGKYFVGMLIVLAIIVGHAVLGYVVPVGACIIMGASYIGVYKIRRTPVLIAWVISVLICYIVTDYISYTPDGISAMYYKHTLTILFAQVNAIVLFVACNCRCRGIYKDTSLASDVKISWIRAVSTMPGIYGLPSGAVVTFSAIFNTFSDNNVFGTMYLISSVIAIAVIAGLHVVTSISGMMLIRSIHNLLAGLEKDETCES